MSAVDLVELALTTDSLRLADVALLRAFDEHPAQVAIRLGVKPGSVGRLLARHGLTDEARPFWREAARTRPSRARGSRGRTLAIPQTPHGTFDRWQLHVALGEQPCASCELACGEYWAARRSS